MCGVIAVIWATDVSSVRIPRYMLSLPLGPLQPQLQELVSDYDDHESQDDYGESDPEVIAVVRQLEGCIGRSRQSLSDH